MRRTLLSLLFAGLAGFALAQTPDVAEPSRLQALANGDANRGWESVGRLNLGRTGFCTGSLISERVVLTAAHCLFDGDTGARVPDDQIEFLAGWRSGRAEAYRGVRRTMVHPDYKYEDSVELDRVAVDLALIELDMPVRNGRVEPFDTGDAPKRGDSVGIVSYATERSEIPSLQETCHVIEEGGGVVMLSCEVDFGASGAPVFRVVDGSAEIVSVVSAKAQSYGEKVALASAFGPSFDSLLESFTEGTRQAGNDAARPSVRGAFGGAQNTAKFVRP